MRTSRTIIFRSAGASPDVNYLMSGFYNAQKGIFVRNYSNIGGIRVNTDYKLGNWIKIGEQLALSQRKTQPLVGDEAELHNAAFPDDADHSHQE